ncbi:hypothetical protein ACTGJ9_025920 [Bradyrhizobium sp. RDM12]
MPPFSSGQKARVGFRKPVGIVLRRPIHRSRALARQDRIDYRQTSRHERPQYRREAIITLLGNWTLDDMRLADGIIAKCRNG